MVARLRAVGDPLHLKAAGALVASRTLAERLQERIYPLEATARINGETIRGMQQAVVEIERTQSSRR